MRAVFAISNYSIALANGAACAGGKAHCPAGCWCAHDPLNDIRIVGEALKSVGFEVLKPVENAQRSAMLIAIHAFAAKQKAAGPDAIVFFTTQVTASHQPVKLSDTH